MQLLLGFQVIKHRDNPDPCFDAFLQFEAVCLVISLLKYSTMKQAVDEIRATGQYVFWRDEDRKKGYVSQYLKRVRNRGKSNGSADESSEY